VPGAAFGASFTALKPCYVSLPTSPPQIELVNLAGSGFTPNALVDISLDGAISNAGVPVDAAGNLGADPANPVVTQAPFVSSGEKGFELVATERGAALPAAAATTRVTALNVGLSPRRARPSSRVRFRGRGFTGGRRVYAHYRYKGKTRRTVRFTASGPCGKFDARARQIPVSRAGMGEWSVQFDQQKKYSRKPRSVFVRLRIVVSRTVRFDRKASAAAAWLTTARGF
jgi:hypothetical protein